MVQVLNISGLPCETCNIKMTVREEIKTQIGFDFLPGFWQEFFFFFYICSIIFYQRRTTTYKNLPAEGLGNGYRSHVKNKIANAQ